MFQVVVREHFDAAHFLRNYQGKCSQLHGHRWDVEICVAGPRLDQVGMLVDFGEIKSAVKEILDKLDHQLINEVDGFKPEQLNPTAENLAFFLFLTIKDLLKLEAESAQLAWIKVYESPDSWAVYKED